MGKGMNLISFEYEGEVIAVSYLSGVPARGTKVIIDSRNYLVEDIAISIKTPNKKGDTSSTVYRIFLERAFNTYG